MSAMIFPASLSDGHRVTFRSHYAPTKSSSSRIEFDYQDFLSTWCPEEKLQADIDFIQNRVKKLRDGWELARVKAAGEGLVLSTAQDELDRLEHGRVQVDGAIQVYQGWTRNGLDMS